MSGWFNRIGDVATTVGKAAVSSAGNLAKFGGELIGAAAAPARFAWDVATAPWNNDQQYNGFIRTFKSAASGASASVIKPFASAGGAIMKVPGVQPVFERINQINRDYIREPLTTFALVQGDLNSNRIGLGEIFDPNEWRKAYAGAQDISFGQAVVGQFRNYYDPKFNIYDPNERDAAFKRSAWGRFLSGGADLGIQLFGDVSLAAGKGLKVLKASELGVGEIGRAHV